MSGRTGVDRKVEHAIRDALRGTRADFRAQRGPRGPRTARAPLEVLVRIEGPNVALSVDASGDRLHRRGWRQDVTEAPIRENLAAAILHLAKWRTDEPLVDPMCGSGTFPIEAATIALGIPPGDRRAFAFEGWPSHDPDLWRAVRAETARPDPHDLPPIVGSDIAEAAVRAARAQRSARRRRRPGSSFVERGVAALTLPDRPGLVVCNPPYGARLKGASAAWKALGSALARRGGWRVALVAPDGPGAALVRATGLALQPIVRFDNGGLPTRLYVGEVGARSERAPRGRGGDRQARSDNAG